MVAGRTNKRDDRRRNRLKTIILLIFSSIMLIIVTIAWFAMNRGATVSGLGVTPLDLPFELEVKGDNIENRSIITGMLPFTDELTDGVRQGDGLLANVFRTAGSDCKIIWRKEAAAGQYPDGLEPGSAGSLTFYVVPKKTGVLDVSFDVNIRGFHAVYDADDELSELIEITPDLQNNPSKGITNASDLKDALQYINGHILFFKNYENGYYSGFCGIDSIDFNDFIPGTDKTVTEGQEYQVTIYWIWANAFVDMVLDSSSPYMESPILAPGSDELDDMYEYLEDSDIKVFSGLSDQVIATHLSNIENDVTSEYRNSLRALTVGYDDADLMIGNNINYILIELNASAG